MKRSFKDTVDIFGNNWSSAVASNSIFSLFVAPLAVWTIICQCYSSLLIKFESAPDSYYIVTFAGLLPAMLILFLGLSGYVYSNKKIFYEQDGAVWKSFKEGFKKNRAKYLLYGFICWLSLTIVVVSSVFYLNSELNALVAGLGVAVSVIQALVFIPMTFICMIQNVFFEDKLKNVFKNAFKILLFKPVVILFSLIAVIPVVITVILPLIWQISAWILVALVFSTVSVTFLTVRIGNIFYSIIENNNKNDI